jgi:hypothetical protein
MGILISKGWTVRDTDHAVFGKERALVQINRLIQLSYLEDQKLF